LTGQGKPLIGKYSDVFLRKFNLEGDVLWTKQFSSPEETSPGKICTFQGGFYAAGMSTGSLGGQNSTGGYDAFLRKCDTNGNEIWTRLCGFPAISGQDYASYPAIDEKGNIYVIGYTYGIMPGQAGSGNMDGFVRKYDSKGYELWTRQYDKATFEGIAVDASGVYIVGHIILKLDANGNELWKLTNYSGHSVCVGTDSIYVSFSNKIIKFDTGGNEEWTQILEDNIRGSIYADASGVYLAGSTYNKDACIIKLDAHGNQLWRREFGTKEDDYAQALAGDLNGIYVVGNTWGSLTGQTSTRSENVFVRKYDTNGNMLWTQQFEAGTGFAYGNTGAFADGTGVYVVGNTNAPDVIEGKGFGFIDGFVRKYDTKGNVLWTHQFGTSSEDCALGVCSDRNNVYVVGSTDGTLTGQKNPGGFDVFIICYPNRK
jgi:hypothetical protein